MWPVIVFWISYCLFWYSIWFVNFLFRKLFGHFNVLTVSFLPAFLASYVAILLERPSRRGLLALYVTNVVSYHCNTLRKNGIADRINFCVFAFAGYRDIISYGSMERACSTSSFWSGVNFFSFHCNLIVLLQRSSNKTGFCVWSPKVSLIVMYGFLFCVNHMWNVCFFCNVIEVSCLFL